MGASESKSIINQLSTAITQVCMDTSQSCEVNSEQNQNIVVNNSGFKLWGSYSLDQQTDIDMKCFSNTNRDITLQNKLIQTISNTSTSKGLGLLGAFGASGSEAKTNLTNMIKNNITVQNIQKSMASIKQSQGAIFSNSGVILVDNVDLKQGGKLLAAATLQELDRIGVFNTISNYVDQKSSAETKGPLDFIGESMSITIIVIFLIIFVVITSLIFITMKVAPNIMGFMSG
jgi:hypothetical protein